MFCYDTASPLAAEKFIQKNFSVFCLTPDKEKVPLLCPVMQFKKAHGKTFPGANDKFLK